MKLTINFDESKQIVVAQLSEDDNASPLSEQAVVDAVVTAGYPHVRIENTVIQQLLRRDAAHETGRMTLCVIKDADVQVSVARDRLTATITVLPANGGQPLTPGHVLKRVQDKDIALELIDQAVLKQCLLDTEGTTYTLAKARLPVNGKAAEYIPLIEHDDASGPRIDDGGKADLCNTQVFQIVEAGTPLMRRIPPTPGSPGMDVCGQTLVARPGLDPGFTKSTPGAKLDPGDPNLLIADIKGHAVIGKHGVMIDNLLRLDGVNLKTGHIYFDGSIEVAGDIEPGMIVDVTGDLIVKGCAERARVRAGNNITVMGGVFGAIEKVKTSTPHKPHLPLRNRIAQDESDIPEGLTAGGNIAARFVNNIMLKAAGDIRVREYIINSSVFAEGNLFLGQKGGKGMLFGGYCHIMMGATINQLGNDSFLATRLKLGELDALNDDRDSTMDELQSRLKELLQLNTMLKPLKPKPHKAGTDEAEQPAEPPLNPHQDKIDKLAQAISSTEQRIQELKTHLAEIQAEMERREKATLIVKNIIYPGVEIEINGLSQSFNEKTRPGRWQVRDNLLQQTA